MLRFVVDFFSVATRAIAFAACLCFASSVDAQGSAPTIDISQETERQIVIAAGTSDIYQGHPYLLREPNDVLWLVWNIGHGGYAGPIAKSSDGGATWERKDDVMPDGFKRHKNCPGVFRLVDSNGRAWIWVFTSQPLVSRVVSGDDGVSWKEEEPLGFANVMAFSSIIPKRPGVQDGQYLGFFHRFRADDGTVLNLEPKTRGRLEVVLSETRDAGFTWSEPRVVAAVEGRDPCEPFAFWAPDGREICCLMRENTHKDRSLVMFSSDAGETWSTPEKTAWELTGDRHIGTYVDNDRLLIAFRDQAPGSETLGHFVGWVGRYEDIKEGRPGDYRVKLLHSYARPYVGDCGYPGVAVLSDGTVVALTYVKYRDDAAKHSIVETRFTMSELDQKAAEERKASSGN